MINASFADFFVEGEKAQTCSICMENTQVKRD